jgi:hypothetical protein
MTIMQLGTDSRACRKCGWPIPEHDERDGRRSKVCDDCRVPPWEAHDEQGEVILRKRW